MEVSKATVKGHVTHLLYSHNIYHKLSQSVCVVFFFFFWGGGFCLSICLSKDDLIQGLSFVTEAVEIALYLNF